MSKFTVILLYPDYATGDYGADVYVQVARANTAEEAALGAGHGRGGQ